MKKFVLLSLISIITVTSSFAKEQNSTEQSKSDNDKTTEFILGWLNKQKWCKQFHRCPFTPGLRTVCGSTLKDAVLDPEIESEGTYFAERNHLFNNMFSDITLDKHSKNKGSSLSINTYVEVKGKDEINHFKNHNELNAKFNVQKMLADAKRGEWKRDTIAMDKYTTCEANIRTYAADNGKPTLFCHCQTKMPYEEFLKKMKEHSK